jgi:phosphate acetyltransferase
MDVPSLDRAIIVTDAAINIFPTMEDKKHIVQNAIDLFTALGDPQPKVAILSAMETVNPEVPSTVEAGRPVQDGRPQADHRRHSGWPAGPGQRHRH